jgi:integrase
VSRPVRSPKIIWRNRAGVARAYADLRAYGGSRWDALCEPGSRQATTDGTRAVHLLSARLRALAQGRRVGRLPLAETAAVHLEQRAKEGKVGEEHLAAMTRSLRRAVEFFKADRDLASIDANAVRDWITWLRTREPTAPSNSDVLHDIYALSNLYLYAPINFPGVLPPHYNPVREIPKQQKPARHAAAEAAFLEPDIATLLLETARIYKPLSIRWTQEPDHVFELVATFLYTGARLREVLGLLTCDISLREAVVNIRSHPHRRLKTETSARLIPLWPEHRKIIKGLVSSRDPQALLFPGPDGRMIGSIDKLWDRLSELGQLPAVRAHMLRHTYCATRLQTLDRGHPVSEFVVSREMGHGSMNLVHQIYGHVQNRRGRFPEVRYCFSDWPKLRRQVRALPKRLAERLAARDATLSEGTAAAGRASGNARRKPGEEAREQAAEQREARARYMREYRKRTSA